MRCKLVMVVVLACPPFLSTASADPTLSVTYDGVNGSGNHTWTAWVGPDPAFFYDTTAGFGGSLAVELAFVVRGSTFVDVAWESRTWRFTEFPGMNPFEGENTFGLWQSDDKTKVFAPNGSGVLMDAGPYPLLYFETLGSEPTTLDYGVAASGDERLGALIAQRGQNFVAEGSPILTSNPFNYLPALAQVSASNSAIVEDREFIGFSGSVSSIPEPTAAWLLMTGLLTALWRGQA